MSKSSIADLKKLVNSGLLLSISTEMDVAVRGYNDSLQLVRHSDGEYLIYNGQLLVCETPNFNWALDIFLEEAAELPLPTR